MLFGQVWFLCIQNFKHEFIYKLFESLYLDYKYARFETEISCTILITVISTRYPTSRFKYCYEINIGWQSGLWFDILKYKDWSSLKGLCLSTLIE